MSPSRARPSLSGRRQGYVGRRYANVWWTAVSSGRFFTWWSAAIALVVSVTILGAYVGIDHAREYLPALGVSVLAWSLLVLAMLPVAYEERRLRNPLGRGVLVLTAIVVVGGIRPLLNDALSVLLLPDPTIGGWPQRIVTNVLVWLLLLSLVGVATVGYAGIQAVGQRLRAALAALAVADRRAEAFERDARAALSDRLGLVRLELAALTAGTPVFDDVRTFSEVVRAASHDLEDRANLELTYLQVDTAAVPSSSPPARPFLTRLRPPPRFSVPVAYVACSAPYTLQAAPGYLVLVAVALAFGLGAAADSASRRVARRPPELRGAVLVIAWVLVGVIFSAVALWLLPASGIIALVPLLAFPGVAVVSALCSDAVHRSVVQARRLTRALADETGALSARTTRTREMLRTAAATMHGYVQGRCVVFAAALEDRAATPEETQEFGARIATALDEVLEPPTKVRSANEIGDMVDAWSHVIEVSTDIEPAAKSALTSDCRVSRQVAEVAREGFLNAVKHSGARHAVLSVREESGGARAVLRVEVVSPGILGSGLGPAGRGIRHLGPGARVYQRGSDVVLDARVPL
jgi:hypothetical protein